MQETRQTCFNNHILSFTKASNIPFYHCNICNLKGNSQLGRYACLQCNFNLCLNCKKAPYALSNCNKGHQLLFTDSNFSNLNGQFTCKNCNVLYYILNGRWNCNICKFDICQNCKKRPYLSNSCKAGHGLIYVKSIGDLNYNCNNCKGCYLTAMGVFFCQECKFHICPSCKSGGKANVNIANPGINMNINLNINSNQVNPIPQGNINNNLNINQNDNPYPNFGSSGIFNSPQNELSNQMNQQFTSKPFYSSTCLKGHNLMISKGNIPFQSTNIYFCQNCQKSGLPVSTGRWNCPLCNYDICFNCKPNQNPMTVPYPVPVPVPVPIPIPIYQDTISEFNFCGNGHKLYYSTESKGYQRALFTCDICYTPDNPCHLGRFHCKTCKFDICKYCKPN